MRIKSIHLTNYKRFSDLYVDGIPASCRLVVLIGPNGSGKSSLFDAFLLKSWVQKFNYQISGNPTYAGYYSKSSSGPDTTVQIAEGIKIAFHDQEDIMPLDWAGAFNIRSPYRNEADFRLQSIEPVQLSQQTVRFPRIIDADHSVSDNYKRLTWKRQSDVDGDVPDGVTMGQYRTGFLTPLQTAMSRLFTSPGLLLQDFGGFKDAGVFRFSKGEAKNFHYKNLSAGEKAAFDLLLDLFVKRNEYEDAIYCIDEPEAHIASALQGPLLDNMMDLVPDESQLWIATHSIGFVRRAYEIMKTNGNVVFLDFTGHNYDEPVTIQPCLPTRSFWQMTYEIALADLAHLIAPANIVICEGNRAQADKGFDAQCYNRVFADSHPDTLFVSYGGANEVSDSQNLIGVLGAVAKGAKVWRLIDGDEMTPDERTQKGLNGIQVLMRRELENYLYDPEVLRTFLHKHDKEHLTDSVLGKREELLASSQMPDDVKAITRELFQFIKQATRIPTLGNSREGFAVTHLAPALKDSPGVLSELEREVFPQT